MMTGAQKSGPGAITALLGVFLACTGCGDDDLPRRHPVVATVNYKGEPMRSGTITFTPGDLSRGRSAGGTIMDGSYSLTTYYPDDGALAGRYKVTIISTKANTDALEPQHKLMYEKALSSPGVPIPAQVKKKVKIETLVPRKYSTPETSDLTAEVKEGDNVINFDLID